MIRPLLPSVLAALAGAAFATGCSSPAGRASLSPPDSKRPDAAVALERETRYYVDEKGVVWDDRGRKQGATP